MIKDLKLDNKKLKSELWDAQKRFDELWDQFEQMKISKMQERGYNPKMKINYVILVLFLALFVAWFCLF